MAEGLLAHFANGKLEVGSAGTHPSTVSPLAIQAMAELGIDLSSHRSKGLDAFDGQHLDVVITVCDRAESSCPVVPGAVVYHWPFEDPADADGSEEDKMVVFRRVRDQIRAKLESLLDTLTHQ